MTEPPTASPRELVWSFGRAQSAVSWVHRPVSEDGVAAAFERAHAGGMTIGIRGGGQSYGDAALASGAICLDVTGLDRILDWNRDTGVVRAQPGVTFAALWRATIADGWWPPVVPGTSAVTLGGGVSMNIHGKNNWRAGPLGDHVLALELLTPAGERLTLSRSERPALFHAVIGGYGMLGVVTSVTLQMKRVYSGMLDVEALAARDLREMFDLFEARLATADYLVGWVDCFAGGARTGRGLVHQATHLPPGGDADPATSLAPGHQGLPGRLFGIVPTSLVWRGLRMFTNDAGMRLLNTAKYVQGSLGASHRYRQSHVQFAFLLDYVPGWWRAYGPGGLIQFQSFVPAGHAREAFTALIRHSRSRGFVPYLGVLKRHRADDFLLTHAVDGYSLAMDFRVTAPGRASLWETCGELAQIVLEAGGRFYPAKDSTLDRATYEASLGPERLTSFRTLKRACDPADILQTDLSRRLLGPSSL